MPDYSLRSGKNIYSLFEDYKLKTNVRANILRDGSNVRAIHELASLKLDTQALIAEGFKMSDPEPDVTLAFQVKGYDIDVGGIVHNSVYLLWLDDIRTAFLEKVQSIEEQVKLGIIPILSRTEISYKRAIKFGNRPIARMHLTQVTRLRWRISCDFVVDGVVTTHAIQEGCLVDLKSGRPVPMPEPFINYWNAKKKVEEQNASSSASSGVDTVKDGNFDPSEAMVCPV